MMVPCIGPPGVTAGVRTRHSILLLDLIGIERFASAAHPDTAPLSRRADASQVMLRLSVGGVESSPWVASVLDLNRMTLALATTVTTDSSRGPVTHARAFDGRHRTISIDPMTLRNVPS